MKRALRFAVLENSVVQDRNFLYSTVSFSAVLAIFVNQVSLHSPWIGLVATVIFFVINAVFLGNAFFKKEDAFLRLMFGFLLLIMLLGLVGWLALIIYNLDVARVTVVLLVVTTLSSLFNRRMKHKNATE